MIDKVLELYQEYTGQILSEAQKEMYAPYALRAVRMLEQKLGWPLDGGSDVVEVLGVAKQGCTCTEFPIDILNLNNPPEKKGIYRLFPLDTRKPNLLTDPFKRLNHVYLARVDMTQNGPNGNTGAVILQTYTDITPVFFMGNIGKYIKTCHQMNACQQACNSNCTNCASVLVDADWMTIDDLPPALILLMCDYIDWVAEGGLANRWIKSESVDGHSVSYGAWITTAPYQHSSDAAIIRSFMGPYGSTNRKYIR